MRGATDLAEDIKYMELALKLTDEAHAGFMHAKEVTSRKKLKSRERTELLAEPLATVERARRLVAEVLARAGFDVIAFEDEDDEAPRPRDRASVPRRPRGRGVPKVGKVRKEPKAVEVIAEVTRSAPYDRRKAERLYYSRRKAAGVCTKCGGPRDLHTALCSACAEIGARRRSRRIASGTCIRCQQPAAQGRRMCEPHLALFRKNECA